MTKSDLISMLHCSDSIGNYLMILYDIYKDINDTSLSTDLITDSHTLRSISPLDVKLKSKRTAYTLDQISV